MARLVGCDDRIACRWRSGEKPMPPRVAGLLAERAQYLSGRLAEAAVSLRAEEAAGIERRARVRGRLRQAFYERFGVWPETKEERALRLAERDRVRAAARGEEKK